MLEPLKHDNMKKFVSIVALLAIATTCANAQINLNKLQKAAQGVMKQN